MEAGNIKGIGLDRVQPFPKSLGRAIVEAVYKVISPSNGEKYIPGAAEEAGVEIPTEPAQVALAVAYANLCLEEPEMVTSSHLKMLRSHFSFEQIQELNQLIKRILH